MQETYFTKIKVNLFLHAIGKQANGYHALESLVAFAHYGDSITIKEKDPQSEEVLSLSYIGPFASELIERENILQKIYSLLQKEYNIKRKFHVILEKNIPIGAGLGGGSGDAAVFLKTLVSLCNLPLSHEALVSLSIPLGSDIAVCLHEKASIVEGTGDRVKPLSCFPEVPILLVNPRLPLSTLDAYKSLTPPYYASYNNEFPSCFFDIHSLVSFLEPMHNIFLPYASSKIGSIIDILSLLKKIPGCLLSRMSGSGSTCFGLFKTLEHAEIAERLLKKNYPHWWVCRSILMCT